jgi:bacillithiol biosynthesis deacetylase BshB1
MIDILAIGAHPDDIELSCAGTLLKQKSLGNSISIVDLTAGELGTRGSAEIRLKEARDAAVILGVEDRMNLGFRDGFFDVDEEHIKALACVIRHKKPRIVLCNALEDRHPDHGKGADLVQKACFYAGLVKMETEYQGQLQEVWRPQAVYHYIQFKYIRPDFLVDISAFYEEKMKSIKAYKSQFYDPTSNEPETMISSKEFLSFLDARMVDFGRILGVKYAEGFNIMRIPGVSDLLHLK